MSILSRGKKNILCLAVCFLSYACLPFCVNVFAESVNSETSSEYINEKSTLDNGIRPSAQYKGDFLIDDNGKLWDYRGESVNVVIPDEVKIIGEYAFSNHSEIKSVKLHDNIIVISHYAFSGCTELEEITIPDSVFSIGRLAFSGCSNLRTANIGSGVNYIGQMCFWFCDSLKKIEVKDENEKFSSYKGVLYDKNFDVLIKCPQGFEGKFLAYKKVSKVCDYAFAGCSKLNKIVFKDGVKHIGKAAFFDCTSLMKIYLGKDLVSIGSGAFADCILLSEINLPDTTKQIDSSAFYRCRSLIKLTITSKDVDIKENVFKGCNSALVIYGYDNSNIHKCANRERINFVCIK